MKTVYRNVLTARNCGKNKIGTIKMTLFLLKSDILELLFHNAIQG